MPCVSSWWLEEARKPAPTPRRRFTIGTSDYTERVDKFPRFQRTTNEIKSININLPLANADGGLNHFYQNTYTIPNTCTLEMGVEINRSGDEGFLAHAGQTGEFTPGNVLYGRYPGSSSPVAAGTVEFNGDNCVYLSGLTSGTFVDGMILYEDALGSAVLEDDCQDDDTGDWLIKDCTLVFDTDHYKVTYADISQRAGFTDYYSTSDGAFYELSIDLKDGTLSGVSGDLAVGTKEYLKEYIDQEFITTASWVAHTALFQSDGDADSFSLHTTIVDAGNYEVRNLSIKPVTNAALASGGIYQSHDEYIKLFTGFLKNVRYSGKKCTLKIKDRLYDFADREVGASDAHVDIGSTIPSDIAWTLCTCYGGLSAVTSTSNPDIDYFKFSTWAAQFSQDSILMSANYQGMKITEALTKLAEMTDSAIWVEGDGKLNFVKFIEPSSLDITFTRDEFADILIDVESLRLVNRHYTNFDYSVESEYWTKSVLSQNSVSVNSFGLYEETQKDETIWYVDSLSALGFSQRKINLLQNPPKRFGFTTGIYGMHKQVSETVRLVDSFYNINSGSGWRAVETNINMAKGLMEFQLDEATVMNAFYLDVSDLDGDDLLV